MYNIENLKKIRQMLIDNRDVIEPRFDMTNWCASQDPDYGDVAYSNIDSIKSKGADCGTVMCIGGWCAYYGLLDGVTIPHIGEALEKFVLIESELMWVREFSYLFGPQHNHDIDEAIARLDYAIEHNDYERNHPIFRD